MANFNYYKTNKLLSVFMASRFPVNSSFYVVIHIRKQETIALTIETAKAISHRFLHSINKTFLKSAYRRFGQKLISQVDVHHEPNLHLHIIVNSGDRFSGNDLRLFCSNFYNVNMLFIEKNYFIEEVKSPAGALIYNSRKAESYIF